MVEGRTEAKPTSATPARPVDVGGLARGSALQ